MPKKTTKKSNGKANGGRPPFEPTDEQRQQVQAMAGMGMRHEDICVLTINPTTGSGVSTATLHKHFKEELLAGGARAKMQIAQSLFARMREGNVAANIFLAKVRLGWSEKVEIEDVTPKYIGPKPMEEEEWAEKYADEPSTTAH
jgi:hypothetical protein